MALQPPPHEGLVDLVKAEQQRQRRYREILTSPLDVATRVDPNRRDHGPSDQITDGRKTHTRPLRVHAVVVAKCRRWETSERLSKSSSHHRPDRSRGADELFQLLMHCKGL